MTQIIIDIPEQIVEQVVRGIMDNMPEASESMDCLSWKYDDGVFVFRDYEDGKRYTLDLPKLKAVFPLLYSDKWPRGCTKPPVGRVDEWQTWEDWLCQADATDFDAFVQLAIFNEVIYG